MVGVVEVARRPGPMGEEPNMATERAAEATISKRHPGCHCHNNWWFYNQEVKDQNHLINIHQKLC